MAAVAHAAHMEADQLKADLKKQQTFLVGKAHDRAQEEATTMPTPGADGMRRESTPLLATRTPGGDCSKPCLPSTRLGESTAIAGELPDPPNLVTPDICGGRVEEEEKKADAMTTAAHVEHIEATFSPSAACLAEAEKRIGSAEKALLEARNSSQTAMEQAELLEQQLRHARAAAGAEAEGKRLAHARIAELKQDVHLVGLEQEAIRVRAESRLERLRAAFEQEELEAEGKVTHMTDTC